MITLLHGDNVEQSRSLLLRSIEEFKEREIRRLDGRTFDATRFTQAFASNSLFGQKTVLVIENFLGPLIRKAKKLDNAINLLLRVPHDVDVILWEDREVPQSVIHKLGSHVRSQLCNIPVLIFQFLDSFKPGQRRSLISLLGQLVSHERAEVISLLLSRRIRQLLMMTLGVIPEGLQPWQLGRLTSQATTFSLRKLQDIYKDLLAIEYSIKSGQSPFTLTQQLEQLILNYM